jgi:hypothetical protein
MIWPVIRRTPEEAPTENWSFGRDRPPLSGRVRLAAVAGACLVGGFLAGDRVNIFGDDLESTAAPSGPLIAVGSIDKSYDAATGFEFELPVLNSSEERIQVRKIDLVGLASRVTETYTPEIFPGEWKVLELEVPADCSEPPPADISMIRLRVERPSGTDDIEVRLPYNGAAVLLDYHGAVCRRAAPVDRGDLAGVWALQTGYGPETDLESSLVMRFTADGTYVWDFDGGLFSGDKAVWGTYRIRGRLLVFMPEGGSLCGPRDISTWRAAVDDQEGVLTMVWRAGTCPDGEGVWIARRILRDNGLPPAPGGP